MSNIDTIKDRLFWPNHQPAADESVAHWAVAYTSEGYSPRARKWYRLVRVVKVDGAWFEVYWADLPGGTNLNDFCVQVKIAGYVRMSGLFYAPHGRSRSNELEYQP